MKPLPIRGHHGMCYAFFHGEGYSNSFTAHMWAIQQLLKENPDVLLLDRADSVCSACPNLKNGSCDSPDKVRFYDDAVLKLCSLTPGTILPWKEFSELVQEKILLPGLREKICGDCQWSSICK